MKKKGKIVGFSIFIVTICALTFLASKTFTKNETLGDTGWTVDQFIEWAYEVQPVVSHKRWKIWKEKGMERKELIEDPNEPFHAGIINDVNDVPWASSYSYEWGFELPKDVPPPVIKVLKGVHHDDIGKNIRNILPYVTEQLVAVCALKDGEVVSSEPLEVKLLSMSNNKLEFTVETDPFILSDNPDVKGRIGGVMVLYIDPYRPPPSEVNICKPEKQRKGN